MMNNSPAYEVWQEIWQITEMRGGAVYKTRYLRTDWVPMGAYGDPAKGLLFVPISNPDDQRNPRRVKG